LFRKRVLQVAVPFVKESRLDDPDPVFDSAIDDALVDSSLDLRALEKEHKVPLDRIQRSHLRSRLVVRVIDSRDRVFYPPRKEAKAGELVGVSICPGNVRGRVKALHRVDEEKLLPGEILVTGATDPGWTPLFIDAGGIVLEIGRALQHGAVVTREYGIPCISGLDGAIDRLRDDQRVEVDGSTGIVRILEAESIGETDRTAGADSTIMADLMDLRSI
jgi:phosphoenolpyruvate synthase/pyruvate phosphate dikinase